ncbi:maleylpyruvate isomerase N-terminal domain-containing protein [Saccharopolyspora sp. NPDC002376]
MTPSAARPAAVSAARLSAREFATVEYGTPPVAGEPEFDVDHAGQRRIRARGEQAAGLGPTDLAERFDAARARLAPRLAALPAEQPVLVFDRWVLPLDQCLLTRLIELAVHLDDLAVSLDLATPAVPDDVAEIVISSLASIATGRHGTASVLRALSRRERAPAVIAAF